MDSSFQKASASLRTRFPSYVLLVATAGLAFFTLIMPISTRRADLLLGVGEVAPQDIQAPARVEYVSDVLTAQARQEAERAVAPVYSPADPNISRQQIQRLRSLLDYITSVRADNTLTLAEKQNRLATLADVKFSPDALTNLFILDDPQWSDAQSEALRVLDAVMRSPVRQEQLETLRENLVVLISLSLNEKQTALVTELAGAYIAPNSFFNQEQTDAARLAAREAIVPVKQTYAAGQLVVRRGELINAAQLEALQALGLVESETRLEDYLGALAAVFILVLVFLMYMLRRVIYVLLNLRNQLVLTFLFLIFLFGARLLIPNRAVVPYVFPLPALGLLASVLFGTEAGLLISFCTSVLSAYGLPNGLALTIYYLLTSWAGLLVLGPARRLGVFFRSALAIALIGTLSIVAYRIPFDRLDWIGLATLTGAAFVNGLASSAITLLLQPLLAQQLGLITALQLFDLARPDHPLLQFFLRAAPGTYQHSLQVANLAEQAGEAVGADTLLIRVGALYHDCGKALNPLFFIENQMPGSINTHDDMSPDAAAALVIRHVSDGAQLARKYRLPGRIIDFIMEHHGTLTARYQYNRAVELAGGDKSKVDLNKFRYPGPAPRSRETALLMLSDGVEARARAEHPKDEAELRTLIKRVIDFCQQDGQLDNTKLTLRDLHLISEAFMTTLRGIYHPRIQYPTLSGENPTEPVHKDKA